MSTTVGRPPTAAETLDRPGAPKRRPWWLIPLILGLLVPAAIFVRDRWVSGYPPIAVGNGLLALDVTGPRKDEVRERSTYAYRTGEPRWIAEVPFQKNGTLRMAFGIYNEGSRPIRISAVGYGPDASEYITVLDPAGVEVGPQCCGNVLRHLRPFEPFTLEPGDNPLIALNYRFVCQRYFKPGSSHTRDTFHLRFETLGSERWVPLALPWRLVVFAPERGECSPEESAYSRTA